MNRKLKIYLDTSVVSHLEALDSPEKMKDTLKLWRLIKNGYYVAVLSNLTLQELQKCAQPKKQHMLDFLKDIKYTLITVDEEAVSIAEKFVDFGVLKKKSLNDCRHIAAAIVSGCDVILSWNFRHIVNHKTIAGAKAVTTLQGYKDLLIYTPSILIGGDTNDKEK
jgi:predicted nucleic acid-binding protein